MAESPPSSSAHPSISRMENFGSPVETARIFVENLPLLAEYLPYPRESAAGIAFKTPLISRSVGDSMTVTLL